MGRGIKIFKNIDDNVLNKERSTLDYLVNWPFSDILIHFSNAIIIHINFLLQSDIPKQQGLKGKNWTSSKFMK